MCVSPSPHLSRFRVRLSVSAAETSTRRRARWLARDVAAEAGDVTTALAAVGQLGQRFDVPTVKLKA
jgi:hypothetical protein